MSFSSRQLPGKVARRLRALVERAFARPDDRECPVCGQLTGRFRPFGNPVRLDAQCRRCGALERHRFAWLLLQTRTELLNSAPSKVLHIAPERCFEQRLRAELGADYVTADLLRPDVDERMDITAIEHPDGSFDAILCSHVLEHVPEDRKAMRELHRVLKSGGWALLDVPLHTGPTFEDPTIVSPQERLVAFGQEDHVRRYGDDYVDRLREAGFSVSVTRVSDLATREQAKRKGILPMDRINVLCRKE